MRERDYIRAKHDAMQGDEKAFTIAIREAFRRGDAMAIALMISHPAHQESALALLGKLFEHGPRRVLISSPEALLHLAGALEWYGSDALSNRRKVTTLLGYSSSEFPPLDRSPEYGMEETRILWPELENWKGYTYTVEVQEVNAETWALEGERYIDAEGTASTLAGVFRAIEGEMQYYPGWDQPAETISGGVYRAMPLVRDGEYEDEFGDREFDYFHYVTITRAEGDFAPHEIGWLNRPTW